MKTRIPRNRLWLKFLVGFLILAVVVSAASCVIGYTKYQNTIQYLYNQNSYDVANIALNYIDGDLIGSLMERDEDGNLIRLRDGAVTTDHFASGDLYSVAEDGGETFETMKASLNNIRADANLQYLLIYIPIQDEGGTGHLTYIFDAENDYFDCLQLGMTDPMNPLYFDEVYNIYATGELSSNYFVSHSAYGYTTSAVMPIYDSAGNVVALLDCYVPMTTIEGTLADYIWTVILATICLVFLFIFIFLAYLRAKVLNPLQIITYHAQDFVENKNNQVESHLEIRTGDEIQILAESLEQMEIDLVTYIDNLTAVTAEKERIGAELDVATHIQASMLPQIFPAFPERAELDIYASMTPAKEVGGDFYDFFLVDDNHMAMVMADVSGKGVPAALFMVISKTLLKNSAQAGLSPADILETVNNQLCENNEAEMFVTVWIGILEIDTGTMVCANAGHEFPVLQRKGGDFELVHDKHGFVLGGMEDMCYSEYTLQLSPGDRLFLYTDGVPEATNSAEELFGNDRMVASLNRYKNGTTKAQLDGIHSDVDVFVGDAPQFDDITMIAFELRDEEKREQP